MKLDLHFGASVHCEDKHRGKLIKVVVNPDTNVVSDLIIQQGLFLRKHAWVVPVSNVARTTPGEVVLRLHHEQLDEFPEYREVEVKEPAPYAQTAGHTSEVTPGFGPVSAKIPMVRKRLREGVAAGREVVGHKTKVEDARHVLGKVDHVVIEGRSGRMTEIVVRKGLIPSYFVVPMEHVKAVSGDYVQTSLSREDLDSLQRYEPTSDSEILEGLYDAMLTEQTPAFREVEPRVEGGVVHLTGSVSSAIAKSHADEIARLIPGVMDVQNDLKISTVTERK